MAKEIDEIKKELNVLHYRINLILSAVRNLLEQNNPHGVNDYLVGQIDRERGLR